MNYSTDARHFLDNNGAIVVADETGVRFSQFIGSMIVAASSGAPVAAQVECVECSGCGTVGARTAVSGAIYWRCEACESAGAIMNWRDTLWDMTWAPKSALI